MRKAQVIVNPISGRGDGLAVVPAIEARLRRLGYAPATFVTRRRGDARDFAAALDRNTSLIVVVGGDGTLNEVINGQTRIPLALFPMGTGNAFAEDQGIRGSVEFLETLLREGVVARLDLGEAGGRRFLNMATCGILGQIHRTFWEGRDGPDGLVRCFARAFTVLRRRVFPPVSVLCDDRPLTRAAHLVVVSNTRTYAPRVSFTPEASPFDGALDVCAMPAPSGLEFLRWFVGVLRRRRLGDPRIRYVRARKICLTGDAMDCAVDGEYVGQGPLTVRILPRGVPIVVPASSAAAREAVGHAAAWPPMGRGLRDSLPVAA